MLLVQWTFGFLSHRQFARTQQPLGWAMMPHRVFLGPLALVLGIINASLGFKLALATALNLLYVPVVAAVFILLALSSVFKNWFTRRWGNKTASGQMQPPANGPYGQQRGQHPDMPHGGQTSGTLGGGVYQHSGAYAASRSDIALGNLGDPPQYTEQPAKPREFA